METEDQKLLAILDRATKIVEASNIYPKDSFSAGYLGAKATLVAGVFEVICKKEFLRNRNMRPA